MKTSIKSTLAGLAISCLTLGTFATAATFISSDIAYAKSEKSNNKSSEGRGRSAEPRGKSENKGNATNSRSSRGNLHGKANNSVEKFFAKLTGKEIRPSKTVRAAEPAKASKDSLHPSELGNMNGALNANVNAVLAHIRNGNTNGPVGHVAALVVASDSADGAQEILGRAALFDAIDASEYNSLEDYYLALEGVPGNPVDPDIEMAEDKELAATDAGFASYEEYRSLLAVPPADPDTNIDQALSDLGVDTVDRTNAPTDLALDSTDPEVLDAQKALEDKAAAEDQILAYWNKNPGGEPDPETGRTDAEERLLSELRGRFTDEELVAIHETVEANAPPELSDTEDCGEEEVTCPSGEDTGLVVE
ncbi:MAG: hypothetical protein HKP37_03145 [Boseongicola sp.]|nr:hypothetical protein [Boseongicola sp.]NNL17717.1 hypothetical protein [Boseongicola sp.]